MLVICNGAIKSGSTWLYNILINLVPCERPPEKYLTANSRKRQNNPCIRPEMLEQFLSTEDFRSTDYISKNHLGRPEHRDLLLQHEHVFVFDIERDIRDVVVSSYYDDRNRNGYKGSFSQYYWESGRYVADQVIRYHDVWRNSGPRFHMVSYESLHLDFHSAASRIAAVFGMELDDRRIQVLHEKTSMGQLRKDYQDDPLYKGERFFRKGIIGDWQNHFDASMADDIEKVKQHGFGPLDWRRLRRNAMKAAKWLALRRA